MFFTPLTRIFIEIMIKDNVMPNSIGKALTQAVQPRSILFLISVEMELNG